MFCNVKKVHGILTTKAAEGYANHTISIIWFDSDRWIKYFRIMITYQAVEQNLNKTTNEKIFYPNNVMMTCS